MEWKSVDTKIVGWGRDIIYANEKFWLAHYLPSGIASSSDLENWRDVQLDESKFECWNLAYGNGKFIATGGSGKEDKTYIAISNDGIDWNYKIVDTGKDFSITSNSCRFLNNRFIFITGWYNYNTVTGIRNYTVIQIYETTDGEHITRHEYRHNGPENIDCMDITYANGLYIIAGESGTILISNNLVNWTKINSGVKDKLVGITYGRNLFVVTGENGIILTSEDGKNWTKQKSNTTSYLIRSKYGNGVFVAVGYNGTILTSLDGENWNEEDDDFVKTVIYGLVFANNYYVISAGTYSGSNTIPIAYAQITRDISYSDDESLYIFDRDLNFLGVIDEFISLRWRRKFFEAGEFELVVAPYQNNIKLLQKDNLIMRSEYTEAAVIDTKSYSDDGKNVQLSVAGNFASYFLKRRIVKKILNYKGNVIDGQKLLLRNMTPLTENFEIEPTSISSDYVEFQCSYENVYEYMKKLSKIGLVGFRLVPNIENKIYRFENYVGLDRTSNQSLNERYCFSKDRNNCSKVNYTDTLVDKCNSVLVGGAGEGSNRVLVEVKEEGATGFDLFETFLDAKSESNNNLSDTDYKSILRTKGQEKLSSETKSIEVTVISNDYKNKWDLGDIVNIEDKESDIFDKKMITEVEEVIENGTKTVYPTFGNPLPEKIELN